MSSEHKGGVVFDYWVSNPWHGRESLSMKTADDTSKVPMATATATRQEGTKRCGDAVGDDDHDTDVPNDRTSDEASTQTSVNDWEDASVPGGDDVTVATKETEERSGPHSAMTGITGRRIIFVEFCTNPDSRIGRLAPPGVEVVRLTIKMT